MVVKRAGIRGEVNVYLLREVYKTNMLDIHRRRTKEAHEVGQPFLKKDIS